MKTTEMNQYGLVELSSAELVNTDGGSSIGGLLIDAVLITEIYEFVVNYQSFYPLPDGCCGKI